MKTLTPCQRQIPSAPRRVAAGLLAAALAAPSAWASERSTSVALLPRYRQECASCHVAYPPGLLPSASWQRILGGLPQHFGVDASLDPATVKELSTWLAAHAADGRRASPPQDRITRSTWFIREHDEVAPGVWASPAVKSPANCMACHAQADQGDFNEHHVRLPR